jgi:hypothetical protein
VDGKRKTLDIEVTMPVERRTQGKRENYAQPGFAGSRMAKRVKETNSSGEGCARH